MKTLILNTKDLRASVAVLRAVNHKLRQRILDLLDEHKRMTVTDLYIKLRMEQSVVSQHLAILRQSGAVQATRQGKYIFYSLDKRRLSLIDSTTEKLATRGN